MGLKVKVFAGPKDYDAARLYREEEEELRVGVDAGLDLMLQAGIPIDVAVGDFDSIDAAHLDRVRAEAKQFIELPKAKDVTDLAFALDYVYQHWVYDSMTVYGGLGGRVDHLVANLNLLKKYDLTFIDRLHRLYVLRKGVHLVMNDRKYVSFFAIEDCYNLSIKGFRYELDNYYLGTNDSLCVSNAGSGEVAFSKGRLLVVESDEDSIPATSKP